MSRYSNGLNTPGLNLRPQDTSSQLVGALNSVFAGTSAAAGAYARIENAKKAEKARIAQDLREAVWPLLAAGRIGPVMDSEFPLDQATAAHARMESSGHIGKIVLEVAGG